jgi:hypothetical protein
LESTFWTAPGNLNASPYKIPQSGTMDDSTLSRLGRRSSGQLMTHAYRYPREYSAPRLTPQAARDILETCAIPVGSDYASLAIAQIVSLTEEADRRGYRPPRGSRMSLTWHFYRYVDRVAQRTT